MGMCKWHTITTAIFYWLEANHTCGQQLVYLLAKCFQLILPDDLLYGFWTCLANLHSYVSQFLSISVSPSIHLPSIHPSYCCFSWWNSDCYNHSALEVKWTLEFIHVYKHVCRLFLTYPPDSISIRLYLVCPWEANLKKATPSSVFILCIQGGFIQR